MPNDESLARKVLHVAANQCRLLSHHLPTAVCYALDRLLTSGQHVLARSGDSIRLSRRHLHLTSPGIRLTLLLFLGDDSAGDYVASVDLPWLPLGETTLCRGGIDADCRSILCAVVVDWKRADPSWIYH